MRWLADKYGITIPEDKPATPEELAVISERESLHVINEFAKNHFISNLHNNEEGKKIGLSYFIERGFRPEIIEKFQLGYCLNKSDDFTSTALDKGYKKKYLEKVGLTKSKNERHFDFFRGRVIFPIHSVSGRVLGFGGRTLITDKKIAKYFNSPESLVYNKSEILYGLHFAKGDIIKYDNCYLCEGYTDVISMYQAGVQNVVSSSGTSLTREQIRLIKRYTKNMTILYDGDAAGIKASFRGIDLILEEGLNVKVVLFPEGEDPDSFAKKSSTTELESYISEHQQDFISFKADILLDSEGNDPIKKAQLIKDITHSVSLIPDQITRNVFIPEVAKRFDIKEDVIWAEVNKDRKAAAEKLQKESLRKKSNLQEKKPTSSQNDPYAFAPNPIDDSAIATSAKEKTDDHNEFDLMRILLKYGSNAIKIDHINEKDEKEEVETSIAELICHELHVDELVFEIPLYQRIYKIIAESLENNTFLKISYFQRLEDQEIVRFATEIEMKDHELSANWITKYNIHTSSEKDKLKHAVMSSIFGFKVSKVEKRINELREILSQKAQELSDDELMEILSEQVALEKVKKVISEKMGRIIIN